MVARHWPALLLVTIIGTIALAACGTSNPTGDHNPNYPYGARSSPASLSKCMRANGVSGFPDPRAGPNGGGVGFPGGLIVQGDGSMVVMGRPFAGPAIKHAEQVCKEYLPPSGPGPTISAAQKAAALAAAACMRRNGVPNFPDPTFTGGHQSLALGSGINPDAPAFQRAAKICRLANREAG